MGGHDLVIANSVDQHLRTFQPIDKTVGEVWLLQWLVSDGNDSLPGSGFAEVGNSQRQTPRQTRSITYLGSRSIAQSLGASLVVRILER